MALTQGRDTWETNSNNIVLPVKAGVKIFEGAHVVVDAGYAKPAVKAVGLVSAGRAEEFVDNTNGNDGDLWIKVKRGCFKFSNDTANPVGVEHLLKDCYMLDDETVSSDSIDSSIAGKVIGIEENEVIVEIR